MMKRLRLRHSNDFARLRADGQVWRQADLLISYAPNELPHNRYGFVTSKRVGNAVTRNRVRRHLREAVRRHHEMCQQGYDIVLIARPSITQKPFANVERIVCTLFAQAGILKEITQ